MNVMNPEPKIVKDCLKIIRRTFKGKYTGNRIKLHNHSIYIVYSTLPVDYYKKLLGFVKYNVMNMTDSSLIKCSEDWIHISKLRTRMGILSKLFSTAMVAEHGKNCFATVYMYNWYERSLHVFGDLVLHEFFTGKSFLEFEELSKSYNSFAHLTNMSQNITNLKILYLVTKFYYEFYEIYYCCHKLHIPMEISKLLILSFIDLSEIYDAAIKWSARPHSPEYMLNCESRVNLIEYGRQSLVPTFRADVFVKGSVYDDED